MVSSPQAGPRLRLEYLDGVRAVAALYVALYHALLTAVHINPYTPSEPGYLDPRLWQAAQVLMYGHFGVSVFIILSGYCLMLPVARRSDGHLPGGTLAFLGRRARRLLPPYYAALALSLLLATVPGFDQLTGTRWDEALPAWDRGVIWSHLLLVQNWSWAWYIHIDMPTWSVSTEWQIYWIFALALLPLARWAGVPIVTVLALVAGAVVPLFFGGLSVTIYYSYVGLFALGMLGATINFSDVAWAARLRERLPWGWLAALAGGGFICLAHRHGLNWMYERAWYTDPLTGVATSCLLVYCTRILSSPHAAASPPWIVRALQLNWLVKIGGFSYSFYLVHDPVLNILHFALAPLGLSLAWTFGLMLAICLPFSLAVAYLFHLVFERPFMPGHPRTLERAAHAAVLSPAP